MALHDPGPVLSEHVGVVAAPADRVRSIVLAVGTGDLSGSGVPVILGAQGGQRVVVEGGPDVFRADVNGVPLTIQVDRDGGWVQARGQWWWCRRFEIGTDASGDTLVRQRTFNCASGRTAALVPFTVGRGHRRAGEAALRGLLEHLSQRLGCKAWMLPDS